jgi:hypothetical protein
MNPFGQCDTLTMLFAALLCILDSGSLLLKAILALLLATVPPLLASLMRLLLLLPILRLCS